MKILLICILIIAYGCHSYEKEDDKIINAKWYYYSYACTLSGCTLNGRNINPLECGVQYVRSTGNQDKDTIYFNFFYKDTTMLCRFGPFNLDGIVIERGLYKPVFHAIKFDDPSNDSIDYVDMQSQEKILVEKILEYKNRTNSWLYQEAKRRGVIK